MTAKYPKFVPVLTTDDFCKGRLQKKDQRCMVGWAASTFGRIAKGSQRSWNTVPIDVQKAIAAEAPITIEEEEAHRAGGVYDQNDAGRNNRSALAIWWNRAMQRIGYTEIQDA